MGVRASDAERERTVMSLRRAYAAGRLRMEELENRIERAYAATWRGELRALTRDLPFEIPLDRKRVIGGFDRFQRALFRMHAWTYVSFNTVCVSVWAWGGGGDFWPAWTMSAGGLLLAGHCKSSRAATRRLMRGPGERRRRAIAA
jgi:Domain of unknown function (DUF1707)